MTAMHPGLVKKVLAWEDIEKAGHGRIGVYTLLGEMRTQAVAGRVLWTLQQGTVTMYYRPVNRFA